MNKITALLAAGVIAFSAVGCSSKSSSSSVVYVTAEQLEGKWYATDSDFVGQGYIFGKNGKVTLYTEISDFMYFDVFDFCFGDERIDKNDVIYEKGTVIILFEGGTMLTLDRIGDEDATTYNGEYVIRNGLLMKTLLQGLGADLNDPPKLTLTIDGKRSFLKVVDLMDYSCEEGVVTISGYNEGKGGVPQSTGKVTIKDDILTLECTNGIERHFRRDRGTFLVDTGSEK